MRSYGKVVREHRLSKEGAERSVDVLLALLGGLKGGGVSLVHADDASNAVPIPEELHAPLIDLVSLLAAKQEASILVLDENDEVYSLDAAKLLQCRMEDLEALMARGGLEFQRVGTHRKFSVRALLKAYQENHE